MLDLATLRTGMPPNSTQDSAPGQCAALLTPISLGPGEKGAKNMIVHRPGIEPGPSTWQALIVPLNHRCFMISWYKIKYIYSKLTRIITDLSLDPKVVIDLLEE